MVQQIRLFSYEACHQELRPRASGNGFCWTKVAQDDGSFDEDDFLLGIEHVLTPTTLLEVVTCRRRCVQSVLQEQARQEMMNPSNTFGWENIAMASFVETRRAAVKERKLGKLHNDSSKCGADLL